MAPLTLCHYPVSLLLRYLRPLMTRGAPAISHKREPLVALLAKCWPVRTRPQPKTLRAKFLPLVQSRGNFDPRKDDADLKTLRRNIRHGNVFALTRLCLLEWSLAFFGGILLPDPKPLGESSGPLMRLWARRFDRDDKECSAWLERLFAEPRLVALVLRLFGVHASRQAHSTLDRLSGGLWSQYAQSVYALCESVRARYTDPIRGPSFDLDFIDSGFAAMCAVSSRFVVAAQTPPPLLASLASQFIPRKSPQVGVVLLSRGS
jgi:hypothetical protein